MWVTRHPAPVSPSWTDELPSNATDMGNIDRVFSDQLSSTRAHNSLTTELGICSSTIAETVPRVQICKERLVLIENSPNWLSDSVRKLVLISWQFSQVYFRVTEPQLTNKTETSYKKAHLKTSFSVFRNLKFPSAWAPRVLDFRKKKSTLINDHRSLKIFNQNISLSNVIISCPLYLLILSFRIYQK